jgi:thioredoxin 2
MTASTADIVTCEKCGKRNRVPAAATGIPKCGNCGAPLPWIAEADDTTFTEVVEQSKLPVLLDLWAPWCGPCRMVSPALEKLARENAGRIKLVKINVDVAPRAAQRFDAQAIPTLLIVQGQNVLSRQVGAAPEHELRNWLDATIPH